MDLFINSRIKVEAEFRELEKIKHPSVRYGENALFNPLDIDFVKELYRIENFKVDDVLISEYFPLENTIKALFEIYTQFMGVQFQVVSIEGSWHPTVRCIQVFDK